MAPRPKVNQIHEKSVAGERERLMTVVFCPDRSPAPAHAWGNRAALKINGGAQVASRQGL